MARLKHGFEQFDDRPGAARAVMHAAIRRAVAARRPVDARERDSIARFLTTFDTLIDAQLEPFDEHASTQHVTASAIVTSEAGVVLHLHKRLAIWLQPGGHIDPGEQPWNAALRETLEETGLPVIADAVREDLMHVDVHPGPRGHTHLDLRYHLTADPVPPAPPAGESPDVRWFSWAEAIAVAEPGLEGVLRAAQPGQPVLRRATVADAPHCARVYTRSKAFGMPEVPEPHTDIEVAAWMADVAIPTMDVWVAVVDGVVVGQIMLAPGWLHHLYIDPSWMGRGVGDQFMALARQRQPDGLQLWAFETNAKARRFYERHGFTAVEFTDGSGNEERWPDVRYEGPWSGKGD
jgi:8-oxo-dGTP pyrophosphatase MutT (NUDIX family)/GNAT superfamily N-acetyltransferase